MSKNYIKPSIKVFSAEAESHLLDLSLDPEKDSQSVSPDDSEVYEGEFGARQHSLWE